MECALWQPTRPSDLHASPPVMPPSRMAAPTHTHTHTHTHTEAGRQAGMQIGVCGCIPPTDGSTVSESEERFASTALESDEPSKNSAMNQWLSGWMDGWGVSGVGPSHPPQPAQPSSQPTKTMTDHHITTTHEHEPSINQWTNTHQHAHAATDRQTRHSTDTLATHTHTHTHRARERERDRERERETHTTWPPTQARPQGLAIRAASRGAGPGHRHTTPHRRAASEASKAENTID